MIIYTPLVGALSHPKQTWKQEEASEELMGLPPPSETFVPFYHPKVRALAFHFRSSSPSNISSSPSGSAAEDTVYGELSISLIPFAPPLHLHLQKRKPSVRPTALRGLHSPS